VRIGFENIRCFASFPPLSYVASLHTLAEIHYSRHSSSNDVFVLRHNLHKATLNGAGFVLGLT